MLFIVLVFIIVYANYLQTTTNCPNGGDSFDSDVHNTNHHKHEQQFEDTSSLEDSDKSSVAATNVSIKIPKNIQIKKAISKNSIPQHVCEECGKVFDKFRQLETHQYNHKSPEEHPFFCTECNKIYKSRQTFKEHQL